MKTRIDTELLAEMVEFWFNETKVTVTEATIVDNELLIEFEPDRESDNDDLYGEGYTDGYAAKEKEIEAETSPGPEDF